MWVAKEKFERMALEKANQEEAAKQAAMQRVSDADFAKYNKVLSRDKITGVQDLEGLYKKVTVSNGELTFSFEVPDKWLVETRNSGEVQMNENELREFLSTGCFYDEKMKNFYFEQQGTFSSSEESSYTGFFQERFEKMPFEDMLTLYIDKKDKLSAGFPNASISAGCIVYSGLNGGQTDFYLLSEQDSKRYYDFDVKNMNISLDISSKGTVNNIILGGKNALSFMGDKTTEYGVAGTRRIFVSLKNINKVFVIYQENANYSNIVSSAFEHLINTFSFR